MSEQSLEVILSKSLENSLVAKPEDLSFLKKNIERIDSCVKSVAYNTVIELVYVVGGLTLAAMAGCSSDMVIRAGGPNANVTIPRIGRYPTATLATNFLNLNDLGKHASSSEKNGIAYTKRGGPIDITHVRKTIDLTRIYSVMAFESLKRNDTKFSFPIREGSYCFVEISYPENWNTMPQNDKEQITQEISIEIGKYLSFNVMTWHEIITWFGYKCTGIYPEFPSSFSWEETYSHALGTNIGAYALKKTGFPVNKNEFNNTVTLALRQKLICLGIQSKETARYASEKVKGKWWSDHLLFFVDIKRRNFGIGLYDGYVTPVLVPGIFKGAKPKPLAVPTKNILSKYGFSIKHEIDPRIWEEYKILAVLNPDRTERIDVENDPRKDEILAVPNPSGTKRIDVEKHYRQIMNFIKEQAVKEYNHNIGAAYSR